MTTTQLFYETPVSWLYEVKQPSYDYTTEDIAIVVCKFFGITLEDIKHKTRKREFLEPRQMVMHLARIHTTEPLRKIGIYFAGKDHSTVIHSDQTIKNLIKTDPEISRKIDKLTFILNTNPDNVMLDHKPSPIKQKRIISITRYVSTVYSNQKSLYS